VGKICSNLKIMINKLILKVVILIVLVIFGLYFLNRSYEGGVTRECFGIKVITKVYENPNDPGKIQQSACIGVFLKQ